MVHGVGRGIDVIQPEAAAQKWETGCLLSGRKWDIWLNIASPPTKWGGPAPTLGWLHYLGA